MHACAATPGADDDDDDSVTDAAAAPDCTVDLECNDGIACTVDHCEQGQCTHAPCTDCCDEQLECVVGFGCSTAPAPCTVDDECDDGIRCTLDRCLDATFCEHIAEDGLCDPGQVCFSAIGCIPTPPSHCSTSDDCFGDMPCLGEWTCIDEIGCQFLSAIDCDDGDACTEDVCVDAMGGCLNAAPTEICNGLDDDCDTSVDEDFDCIDGSVDSCTTTCGSTGTATCEADCSAGPCVPPVETCNGDDDDCDTDVDEGFACIAGTSGSCTTTCSSTGTRDCLGDCSWDTCVPPAESCNGADDDCDVAVDETFACVAGSTIGSCTTSCGSAGTLPCTSSCTVGTCQPPPEVCNGADDDCVAGCDDTFSCCRGTMVDCSTLSLPDGMAVCRSDCSGYDTSGCTGTPFDPTGTYLVTPAPTYSCAFGLVSYSIGTMVFSDSGTVLIVTGAPCPMSGPSAAGGTINVSCTLAGSCDEIYALTGTFTGPDTWTGTFTATFVGSCFDCLNQSTPVTGMR